MHGYNKLKQRTLSVLAEAEGQWLRPKEVARQLDFRPRRSAWTYLNRLRRFGLLQRRFSGKGTLQYRISKAGVARLQWLRAEKT